MSEPFSEFLAAFVEIEKHVRRTAQVDRNTNFSEALERAARKRPVLRHLKSELKDLADLRNFLVHGYNPRASLARPTDLAIKRINLIKRELLSPPKLVSLFPKKVERCSPLDPIGTACKKMLDLNLAQLPVYRDTQLIGLLRGETVARWLGKALAEGVGLLEERLVREVLKHRNDARDFALMDRNANAYDALEAFEESFQEGKYLTAIIVTNSGKRTESPLAIVAISEVPHLQYAVGL